MAFQAMCNNIIKTKSKGYKVNCYYYFMDKSRGFRIYEKKVNTIVGNILLTYKNLDMLQVGVKYICWLSVLFKLTTLSFILQMS